jgi:hypothetical protein
MGVIGEDAMVAFGYTLLTEQRGSRGLVSDLADAMVAVQPRADLVRWFDDVAGATVHKIGRLPISWDRDGATAVARAHEQFRWFAGGCKVNAELPGTAAFAFRQPVRPTEAWPRRWCADPTSPRTSRGFDPSPKRVSGTSRWRRWVGTPSRSSWSTPRTS